jgi:predicted O-linked N-acetylglucosamine transferase (SPINDLY family)
MPELVMADWSAYEAEAVRLAEDPDRLTTLHGRLEEQRLTAPLFDTSAVVRGLERIYERAWDRFEVGESLSSFSVVP